MKRSLSILALLLFVGCSKEHDKIGDAPRTESNPTISGWKEISTSGVALSFPQDWKAIDVARETFDKGSKTAFGNDPKFASLVEQANAMAKQGAIKLMVFDLASASSGFATNCNIVMQDMPPSLTIEQIAEASKQQMAPAVAAGTQPEIQYVQLKPGKAALIKCQINRRIRPSHCLWHSPTWCQMVRE